VVHPRTNKKMMPNSPRDRELIRHYTALAWGRKTKPVKVIRSEACYLYNSHARRDAESLGLRPDARD
jgi:hypothetical protein